MPKAPEEVLQELQECIELARTTLRKMHEEIQEAKAVVKNERDRITKAIVDEVSSQVKDLSADARNEMALAVDRTITAITDDWREKLGI